MIYIYIYIWCVNDYANTVSHDLQVDQKHIANIHHDLKKEVRGYEDGLTQQPGKWSSCHCLPCQNLITHYIYPSTKTEPSRIKVRRQLEIFMEEEMP
jgi:hypothetical protein